MNHYNSYLRARIDGFVPLTKKKPSDKRYDLLYRGQTIVSNKPYPVCNGKKSKLLKEQPQNYQRALFEIKLHV